MMLEPFMGLSSKIEKRYFYFLHKMDKSSSSNFRVRQVDSTSEANTSIESNPSSDEKDFGKNMNFIIHL